MSKFKAGKNDTILVMIESKSHSLGRFSFSVSRLFLNSYNPVCNIIDCFVCKSDKTIYTFIVSLQLSDAVLVAIYLQECDVIVHLKSHQCITIIIIF